MARQVDDKRMGTSTLCGVKKYGLYGTIIQITNTMMEPTKVVEQVCRLAEYIWALEKGMNTTKAYALIAKTHFDYAIKTQRDRLIELIFPFYTFTMNNIHFWLDAFDRVPALGLYIKGYIHSDMES